VGLRQPAPRRAQLPAICTFKVARRLWPREAPAHGNGPLRYWLEDRGEIACDEAKAYPPHRAGPDTYVTANILRHMLTLTTASQMVAWTKEPVLQPTILFGNTSPSSARPAAARPRPRS
jgi:exodeoxyribonuclease X